MKTITNGIILKGYDLTPTKSNMLIDEGKIIEISDKIYKGEIIDVSGAIICPSFLNGHTHIGDSIIKDCGDGKSMDDLVKPPLGLKHLALSRSSDDEIISAMKDSMWEMLKTGTTHFIDYREGGLKGIELLKKAASEIPINPIILGRDPIFHNNTASAINIRKTTIKLLENCDGIGVSGLNEVRSEVCEIIVEECFKRNKISSIHVGEYLKLQEKSIKETGKTEIERAIELNFQLLIHSTYPKENDIKLISENNKILTICPRSNGTLSLGIPPFLDFKKNGIKTLLGTDNIMFNSPNLMREMEYSLKALRAKYKTYINPKDILKLSTVEGSNNLDKNNSSFYSVVNKSVIEEGNDARLFISKLISKNPYLNIINRVENENVIATINKNKFLYWNKR
ncbi:MAG: amidohydrolase family protein [Methanobrevibacter sp.]|jgi:cytosine/adenosine deaminase-related metal-dependent hydrolase|nr:amidohydrolase family protein [Methanobrevibacter sp.]